MIHTMIFYSQKLRIKTGLTNCAL